MTHHERVYWLGFSLIPHIGIQRIKLLHQHFGSLQQAWIASQIDLHNTSLDQRAISNIIKYRTLIDLDNELDKLNKYKSRIIALIDDEYPALLREINDPPPVLYVRGTLKSGDKKSLAVVGTRKATKYGLDATRYLCKDLTRHGITIISGLAHGIDAAAHRTAVHGGGRTIAVLGCGMDIIYPRDHSQLAQEIIENGALISEFSLGTAPDGRNFPRRNRIISGMSLGVLVIEAPEGSGAIITTTTAQEQGRDVFAVPANIFNATGAGANRLIQDGAKLVQTAKDIIEELDINYEHVQVRTEAKRVQPANALEQTIMKCLSNDPLHIDDIVRSTGLSIQDVSSTLTILELKGVAQMVGQMQYSLTY